METLGRYQLLKHIASGGMGEIFLARSASLDGLSKDVVVKRILPELTASARFVSRFIDEARVSMTLSHQNIVQVFDFGQAEGSYYLVMEHVLGCDLQELLRMEHVKQGGLSPGIALYIIEEACKGLEYAHNCSDRSGAPLNLIHRDISPGNIMVTLDGGVKVGDFGIAKAAGQGGHTSTGMAVGKLHYMSPEQATDQTLDRRTDIFSLGLVLWELLVGRRPYAGKQDHTFLRQIMTAAIVPPSGKGARVSPEVDAAVMKCVAPDREQRWENCRALARALHELRARLYPDADSYGLQTYLEEHESELRISTFDDFEQPTHFDLPVPAELRAKPEAPEEKDTAVAPGPDELTVDELSAPLQESVRRFEQAPTLWELVGMGSLCAQEGDLGGALGCYRIAAVKFAQADLLAHALVCAKRMLEMSPFETLEPEFAALPDLVGKETKDVAGQLFVTGSRMDGILRGLLMMMPQVTASLRQETPLLSSLGGAAFAGLVHHAPLRRYEPGQAIVQQGAEGETMFLIGFGRAIVKASREDGDTVNLASLTAGDVFGENSFFTGAPRSATVEAADTVEAVEIDRRLYLDVMKGNADAERILLRFYKERIVDVLLATSPTFGLLDPVQRRGILDQFDFRSFTRGDPVISPGVAADEIYLIKEGQARVYSGTGESGSGASVVLGPGAMLGEHAALHGQPQPAGVIAETALEVLTLGAETFRTVMYQSPELRARIEAAAQSQDPVNAVADENWGRIDELLAMFSPPDTRVD